MDAGSPVVAQIPAGLSSWKNHIGGFYAPWATVFAA
jgi:hypothetical protein